MSIGNSLVSYHHRDSEQMSLNRAALQYDLDNYNDQMGNERNEQEIFNQSFRNTEHSFLIAHEPLQSMDENEILDTLDDAFLGDNILELQNTKPIMIDSSTQTKK